MTDEPARYPQAQPGNGGASDNGSLIGLLGVFVVIVIVVLALLMLNNCDALSDKGGPGGAQGKRIVPVTGLIVAPGQISAWAAEGTDINELLLIAGLRDSTVTSMGGGRYVITVPAGSEDTVIKILANKPGVYDAGRVYSSPSK